MAGRRARLPGARGVQRREDQPDVEDHRTAPERLGGVQRNDLSTLQHKIDRTLRETEEMRSQLQSRANGVTIFLSTGYIVPYLVAGVNAIVRR